jgi:hypothetical protein
MGLLLARQGFFASCTSGVRASGSIYSPQHPIRSYRLSIFMLYAGRVAARMTCWGEGVLRARCYCWLWWREPRDNFAASTV